MPSPGKRAQIPRFRFDREAPSLFPCRLLSRLELSRRSTIWNEHAYFELAFVHEGGGVLKTLSRKRRFRKGAVVCTNTGEAHRWFPDGTAAVSFLQFHHPFLAGLEPLLSDSLRHPDLHLGRFMAEEAGGCTVIALAPRAFYQLSEKLESLRRELAQRAMGIEVASRAIFLSMLVDLRRALEGEKLPETRVPSGPGAVVAQVCEFIQAHYADDMELAPLAARTPYSADYFSRLFKQKTSYHLAEYVGEVRIREACRLLAAGAGAISEVALRVGYRNIPYFNRSFRRVMGLSPSEYQRGKGNRKAQRRPATS